MPRLPRQGPARSHRCRHVPLLLPPVCPVRGDEKNCRAFWQRAAALRYGAGLGHDGTVRGRLTSQNCGAVCPGMARSEPGKALGGRTAVWHWYRPDSAVLAGSCRACRCRPRQGPARSLGWRRLALLLRPVCTGSARREKKGRGGPFLGVRCCAAIRCCPPARSNRQRIIPQNCGTVTSGVLRL